VEVAESMITCVEVNSLLQQVWQDIVARLGAISGVYAIKPGWPIEWKVVAVFPYACQDFPPQPGIAAGPTLLPPKPATTFVSIPIFVQVEVSKGVEFEPILKDVSSSVGNLLDEIFSPMTLEVSSQGNVLPVGYFTPHPSVKGNVTMFRYPPGEGPYDRVGAPERIREVMAGLPKEFLPGILFWAEWIWEGPLEPGWPAPPLREDFPPYAIIEPR
jgi:hypothetical protein